MKKENKSSQTKGLTYQYEEHRQNAQETPKQLRSYKRKITEQNFSHKVNTKEAQNEKQNEDDKEHIVVNTRTPSYFEEEPMDKALETGISEATSPKVERNDYCFQSSGAIQWRPKTRASNKLHMNIKRALNPKLKSKTIVNLDETSSEEDTKSKEMEEILSQALENIEESIKLIP